MTREYIQRLASRLLAKYRLEAVGRAGHPPTERLLSAANALDGIINRGDTVDCQRLMLALDLAKDDGTAGYEMWLAGRAWLDLHADAE